jgi:ribose transport system substrate-binding protein
MSRKTLKCVLAVVLILVAGLAVSASSVFAADGKIYEIAVIIKATDSDFWQTVLTGAKKAMEDNPSKIHVTTYGPPSESDIDEQVSILENVISTEPDAIVIASTSSEATIPAIEDAMKSAIPVVLIDNRVHTDNFTSFLATNNYNAGGLAADAMVAKWKEKGIDPSGKKAIIISSIAGVQVMIDRHAGFSDRLKELVPGITLLDTRYTDNDVIKALSITQDVITATPDLVGIFAGNNHAGVGVARALLELKASDSIMAYAFDSDEEEISALKAGTLKGLVLQDPFGMGYKGVMTAVDALESKPVEKEVDTGATVATPENMNEPAIAALLDPSSR